VCYKCHKKGHIKKNCPKSKNVSSMHFDHCYVLTHNVKDVHAKFVGTSIVGNKKKAIWVPKTLVTNIQGPKQIEVFKLVPSVFLVCSFLPLVVFFAQFCPFVL
jgi:hypothetical protein